MVGYASSHVSLAPLPLPCRFAVAPSSILLGETS